MAMTYAEALYDSSSLFENTTSTYSLVLETGANPVEAYRVFRTKEAAETIVAGDEGFYDIYPGAVVSVVNDTSVNNGLYHVELADQHSVGERYKLVKMLSEENAPSGGGSITVEEKDPTTPSVKPVSPYIYFVGVDSSTTPQNDVSILYFNHGIVYDASGNMVLTTSDTRLKDIKGDLDVDIDSLVNLDKVYFSWKQDESHRQCIGVTAQSVEALFPELVVENPETGYKMVNYAGLSVIALAAIDKLADKYNDLERRLHELEQKI